MRKFALVPLIFMCACNSLDNDKGEIKKISHDVIDEVIDEAIDQMDNKK